MPALIGAPRNSLLVWQSLPDGPGDTPATILPAVIERLRTLNRESPAREYSLAITHAEEALHWLGALNERRRSA
jgi:hypothetical protein